MRRTLFGNELRRRRVEAGLSLQSLAALVHYTSGHLSKVENGHKAASRDLARRCDAALSARGELLARHGEPEATRQHTEPHVSPVADVAAGTVWHLTLGPNQQFSFAPSTAQAPSADAVSLPGLRVPARPTPTGSHPPESADAHRRLLDCYRALGQATSPRSVLPGLIAQTYTLRDQAVATRGAAGAALLRICARFAEFTGWMAQEAGDDSAAMWWTGQAVGLANAGDDRALASYALIRRALVALYREDALEVVALARRAQAEEPAPSRVGMLGALREAQGFALMYDYDQCRRALDRAAELVDYARAEPDGSGEPVLGPSHTPDALAVTLGWCFHELGRAGEAVEVLQAQFALLPATAHRARSRWGARLALASLATGELEAACALLADLLPVLGLVDSATVRSDVRKVKRMLLRWNSHSEVRSLLPALDQVLHAPVGHYEA